MNRIFQQKMAVVMNQSNTEKQKESLSSEDKKKLATAYMTTFFGLAITNWLHGKTLGAAWYNALSQMRSYISAKNKNNPATMHLAILHSATQTKWSKLAMTSENRNNLINCTPEQTKELLKFAAHFTSRGLNTMNTIMGKYNVGATKQQFVNAQTNIANIIKLYMAQQQKTN